MYESITVLLVYVLSRFLCCFLLCYTLIFAELLKTFIYIYIYIYIYFLPISVRKFLTGQFILYLAEVKCLKDNWLRPKFSPEHFAKCLTLSKVLHFWFRTGCGLLLCGLTPVLLTHVSAAFIISEFFNPFSEGFVNLFLFLLLVVVKWRRKCRSHCLTSYCRFSSVSDNDIVQLVLMLPSNSNLSSVSSKPVIFTNSSSVYVSA